jgi:translation initiation factor 5B
MEINKKQVEVAKKGQQVAVRIESPGYDAPKMVGRHFSEKDDLVSKITRQSIDVLKECFRQEVSKEEWLLIKKLKVSLNID